MEFKFKENIESFMKILAKNALINNVRVFFVGGCVRDIFLGVPTKDVDFLVQGNALDFVNFFKDEVSVVSVHDDFATVKVLYKDIVFDIASSRVEHYPYSGCLPCVDEVGCDINIDVKRRDFTVNSIYVEFFMENDNLKFRLFDFVDGINDINNKTLRVLHNKSYVDDPTRILRGLDFKYRFGFKFSENDLSLIKKYLLCVDYEYLSIDRAYSVLRKLFLSDKRDDIFREIIEKKYYKIFTPINLVVNFDIIKSILNVFSLNTDEISEFYISIVKNLEVKKFEFKTKVQMIKFFSRLDRAFLAYYFYKTSDENVNLYYKIKDIKLNITGNDLFLLNYPKGKLIGEILNNLYEKKLSNLSGFSTKNDELNWVKNNFPLL